MSYLVFARKWRPRDFDEVVGQEHVTRTLKNAVVADKLAHAYLFAGPQGVGKTSCARILAKALNCAEGPTEKPCGACSACREIADSRSLDVIEIDGASNRGIDEIRTLRENVKFAPLNGRTKIYIIDEVHMLTPEAFNALLKTLEEPPPYVAFVFATTQPQKVPATILSRCQRFDFVRIPNLKIIEKLKEICRQEDVKIEEEVFLAIAKAADGSLRDAESVLDQLISFSQKDVRLKDAVAVLGIIEQEAFYTFADRLMAHDPASAINLVAEVSAKGKDMRYFLEGLLEYYRNLMVLKVVKGDAGVLIDLPKDALERLSRQAASISLADVMTSITHIFAAQEMARKLSSVRISLEVLAVKLSQIGVPKTREAEPPPQKPPVENKTPLTVLKEEKGAADSALSSFTQESSTTLEEVKSRWPALLDVLSQKKMSLATYLREATPVLLENNTLTIGFPKRAVFFKEALAHKDNLKIFEGVLDALLHCSLKVKLDIVESETGEEDGANNAEKDPMLKSALDLFKGKVIHKT